MIHIDLADQDPAIPSESDGKCPDHPTAEVEQGYGMAGGGMGSYRYCSVCGNILDKQQDASYE